jgi:hypothetical protein
VAHQVCTQGGDPAARTFGYVVVANLDGPGRGGGSTRFGGRRGFLVRNVHGDVHGLERLGLGGADGGRSGNLDLGICLVLVVLRDLLALHDHRGHALLLERPVDDVGQADGRGQIDKVILVGKLDGGDDDKVLPVDLGKGDALGLSVGLLGLPLVALPPLPFGALLDLAQDLALALGGPLGFGVKGESACTLRKAIDLGAVGLHDDGVLRDNLVVVAEEGVLGLEEVELIVVLLPIGQLLREARAGAGRKEGCQAENIPVCIQSARL